MTVVWFFFSSPPRPFPKITFVLSIEIRDVRVFKEYCFCVRNLLLSPSSWKWHGPVLPSLLTVCLFFLWFKMVTFQSSRTGKKSVFGNVFLGEVRVSS